METESSALPSAFPYFVNWGGDAAVAQARLMFDGILGHDLQGKRVLEIGAGRGKMSILFALLGAEVLGVDVAPGFASEAREEALKWGVSGRVAFEEYSGSPSEFPIGAFDLIFTKSVLLYMDDLEAFMRGLDPALKPGGQVCFLENISRNLLDRWLRNLVHRKRGTGNFHYMDRKRIAAIGRVFDLRHVGLEMNPLWSRTPGWYLIHGQRRVSGDPCAG